MPTNINSNDNKTKLNKSNSSRLLFWQVSTFILLFALLFVGTKWYVLSHGSNKVVEQVSQSKNFEAVDALIKKYYIRPLPSTDKTNEYLVKGYVAALEDKYSIFLNSTETQQLTDAIDERYSGIGISYDFVPGMLNIIQVFDSSPASKAGIKPGDKIITVAGKSVADYGTEDAVIKAIRGVDGTTVEINWTSGTESKSATLTRAKISVPLTILTFVDDVAYLKINSFGSTLDKELGAAFAQVADKKITKLVIDLQNNGGGYLNAASDLVSYFTDPGQTVVIEKKKDSESEDKTIKKNTSLKGINLVVLINAQSASASEISALALKEIAGATLIGDKSYGKGVVQSIFSGANDGLENSASLKLTTAEWLSPKRTRIDGVGIQPDIKVKDVSNILSTFKSGYDWTTKTLKQ